MVRFRLEGHSGQPAYRQIVRQVKHALRLGVIEIGDQLPTVKDVVSELAINPNTVLKAYRELEYEGLVRSRAGLGTFVVNTLPQVPAATQAALKRSLSRWVRDARQAGLDEEGMESLFADAVNLAVTEEVAS